MLTHTLKKQGGACGTEQSFEDEASAHPNLHPSILDEVDQHDQLDEFDRNHLLNHLGQRHRLLNLNQRHLEQCVKDG